MIRGVIIFTNNLLRFDKIHNYMLNLEPYHLMVNSVYTSGLKHPSTVGDKKKKETHSTKGSCQTVLSPYHYKSFISIYEYFWTYGFHASQHSMQSNCM